MQHFAFSALCMLFAGCATTPWVPPHPESGRQIARWVAMPTEEDVRAGFQCWVYLPSRYQPEDDKMKWPLLLFLHGSGEVGDDINRVRNVGIPRMLAHPGGAPKNWPFITVSPQAPAMWFNSEKLLAFLDAVEREYNVDTRRVYVTGLSMGGIGTWELAALAPERFAAVAPVCGAGRHAHAPRLVNLPVWAFHGEDDKNVPPSGPFHMGPFQGVGSVTMVEAIKKAGGTKAKTTLYPDTGHNAWDRTYTDPMFYKWLLSHALP